MKLACVLSSVVFSALLPSVAAAQVCSGNNVIGEPEEFVWQEITGGEETYYEGTLEIAEETLTIGGDTITTRVYRQAGSSGTIPGPTMVM